MSDSNYKYLGGVQPDGCIVNVEHDEWATIIETKSGIFEFKIMLDRHETLKLIKVLMASYLLHGNATKEDFNG